ncbi:hypothetical protein BY458DRAFT_513821 [Sporodiniella umbellata]|nr:hypothetical protein BY458DRAFT_513821 [Sporodiniella umbellata]
MSTELVEREADGYFETLGIFEIRALEQKTRVEIESKKQDLRTMVSEHYLELMSAADAIIGMKSNTQILQTAMGQLQSACNVEQIQSKQKQTVSMDSDRQAIYVIASVVKCLADVSEQIWHALEHHDYLHASRLYALAKAAHEYLEGEKGQSSVDIESTFPVIESQWNAIRGFESQIIQRSMHHLATAEQSAEDLCETLLSLIFLSGLTYGEVLEKLLAIRLETMEGLLAVAANKKTTMADPVSWTARQIKEALLILEQTFQQIQGVFLPTNDRAFIERFSQRFATEFLLPSQKPPHASAIQRLFSPTSNVHLIVRYLPRCLQHYQPVFEPGVGLTPDAIEEVMKRWLEQVERGCERHLPDTLAMLTTERSLVEVRAKVWQGLNEAQAWDQAMARLWPTVGYDRWDRLLRPFFQRQARHIIDSGLQQLSAQPEAIVWAGLLHTPCRITGHAWPGLLQPMAHQNATFLPNVSSKQALGLFKASLTESAYDRTELLKTFQDHFDQSLHALRQDLLQPVASSPVQESLLFSPRLGSTDAVFLRDTQAIHTYFQTQCFHTTMAYANQLRSLIQRLEAVPSPAEKASDLSLLVGRLARNIAISSKELPKALALSAETVPEFVLKRNKDPKYSQVQAAFLETFEASHSLWLSELENRFGQKLKTTLEGLTYDDRWMARWENVEEEVRLPIQSTAVITRCLFFICQELKRVNSCMLDQVMMKKVRERLLENSQQVFQAWLEENTTMTESGSIQAVFDYLFLKSLLIQAKSEPDPVVGILQRKMDPINWESYQPHLNANVEKFGSQQSLLFGVLTNAGSTTYERARKVVTEKQQGQSTILMSSKAKHFVLHSI